jgi:hypothetical protein
MLYQGAFSGARHPQNKDEDSFVRLSIISDDGEVPVLDFSLIHTSPRSCPVKRRKSSTSWEMSPEAITAGVVLVETQFAAG